MAAECQVCLVSVAGVECRVLCGLVPLAGFRELARHLQYLAHDSAQLGANPHEARLLPRGLALGKEYADAAERAQRGLKNVFGRSSGRNAEIISYRLQI